MLLRFFISLITIFSLLIPVKAFAVTPQLPPQCGDVLQNYNYPGITPAQKKAFVQGNPECFPPNQSSGPTSAKTGILQLLAPFSVGIARVQAALANVSLSIFLTLVVFTIIVSGVKIAFGSDPPTLGIMKTSIAISAVYVLVNIGPAFLDGLLAYAQGQGDMVSSVVLQNIKQTYQPGHGGLINSTSIQSLPNNVSLDAGSVIMEGVNIAVAISRAWAIKAISWGDIPRLIIISLLGLITAGAYIIVFAIAAVESAWLIIESHLIVMLSSLIFALSVLDVYRSYLNKIIEVMVKQCLKIIVIYAVLTMGYVISNAAVNMATTANGKPNPLWEMIGIAIIYGMIVLRAPHVADLVFSGSSGSGVAVISAMFGHTQKAAGGVKGAIGTKGVEPTKGSKGVPPAGILGAAAVGGKMFKKSAENVVKKAKGGSQEEKANVPGPNTVNSNSNSKTPPPGNPRSQNSPGNLAVPPASFSAPKNTSATTPSSPSSGGNTPSGGKSSPGPEPKKEK